MFAYFWGRRTDPVFSGRWGLLFIFLRELYPVDDPFRSTIIFVLVFEGKNIEIPIKLEKQRYPARRSNFRSNFRRNPGKGNKLNYALCKGGGTFVAGEYLGEYLGGIGGLYQNVYTSKDVASFPTKVDLVIRLIVPFVYPTLLRLDELDYVSTSTSTNYPTIALL
ncbi:hypothetical protein VIN7_7423 [Saccharomyces cerevisiae x Saccharomyces kudriavzevii VIN7]|uniref:Uncharacterized protein n=1 Tax=Saccharomyces cerevisiae x Saccharomyces kudriavzevii (strain VIN7) TaxID=1095631 RepID=H0GVH8_SACCK|nr:hypothetical protein VIN7_7423 [Saccharomyces cerevisiae x Saccharomyces kudriavzevii VIN7]